MRKNAQANDGTVAPPGYNDYHEPQYPLTQAQQMPPPHQQPITVFGVSSGAGGSVRSFKKTTTASGSRLAVNELFSTHGPPLPPANQHPMQKKLPPATTTATQLQQLPQQLQQQSQISPQSVNTPVGRNISAMLDENNTVRCYLEPLEK